jgi:hypothetical protein
VVGLRGGAGRAVSVHAAPLAIVAPLCLRRAGGDARRCEDGAQEQATACGLPFKIDTAVHVVSISSRVENAAMALPLRANGLGSYAARGRQ